MTSHVLSHSWRSPSRKGLVEQHETSLSDYEVSKSNLNFPNLLCCFGLVHHPLRIRPSIIIGRLLRAPCLFFFFFFFLFFRTILYSTVYSLLIRRCIKSLDEGKRIEAKSHNHQHRPTPTNKPTTHDSSSPRSPLTAVGLARERTNISGSRHLNRTCQYAGAYGYMIAPLIVLIVPRPPIIDGPMGRRTRSC